MQTVTSNEARARVDASRAVRPLKDARILIVEDEVLIAMEIEDSLSEAGAHVIGPSHTLGGALERAKQADIAAAVLDLRLGDDSVAAVARVLEKRGIPFLFYTGQSPRDPIRAEWPDAVTIAKPASGAVLVAEVAKLLRAKQKLS